MTDDAFDAALIAAAFADAAQAGWSAMSLVRAARSAGLDLARARARMPGKAALLLAFGRIADQSTLAANDALATPPDAAIADVGPSIHAPAREQLFDMLMRRLDALQAHRGGMLALLHALPTQPLTAVLLATADLASMSWMLAAAGVPETGPAGALRAKVLLGVWLWTLRGWASDDSADMSATMATLDVAITRGMQLMRL